MKRRLPESALALVARTRRTLIAQSLMQALLWGCAVGLLVLAFVRIAQPWLGAAVATLVWLPAMAAAAAVALVLWRQRDLRRLDKVALWIEERLPQMRYALLSLVDRQPGTKSFAPQLQRQVRAAVFPEHGAPQQSGRRADRLRLHLLHRLRTTVLPPLAVLLVAALAHAVATTGWQHQLAERWRPKATRTTSDGTGIDRFANLHITLTPPAYTGWPEVTLGDVETIRGVSGSRVVLRGLGGAEGIAARVEGEAPSDTGEALRAERDGSEWSLGFVLPKRPGALLLSDDTTRRVIVLEPRADAAPMVRLLLPERDETIADDSGSLELSASLSDDIALAEGWFEIIVASGEGEGNFEFSTTMLLKTHIEGDRTVLNTSVSLASFGLRPGGQLSIRAVGVDGNDLNGPGIGYSETRTIRLARAERGNEAEITPAPPVLDESLMSLRMLIVSTERLDGRRAAMDRDAFLRGAAPLARHSETIREKIVALVDEAGQGGAFPVPALLTVALEAMWEATRNMYVAETSEALPHMRRAHEAMKALTNLSRYFFRGESLPAYADVDAVRMTGEESVSAFARSTRHRVDSPRQRLASLLRELQPLLASDPAQAQEGLALVRVEALRDVPEAAEALEAILTAVRSGKEYAPALAQLQERLEGSPRVEPVLSEWTPAPALQGEPQP